ncbi:hypothetical protein B5J99_12415 [Blastomonas fulva]|uniref:Uncharacterized protein n=1 Tax=Blastomonas fulva TaxID=1550728 RepID=A0ABN5B7I2_9SPHN|nr:hypothetical protein B5J99_12415 [Blastomonas fulva]
MSCHRCQIFFLLERDGNVAIEPEIVVEAAQIESLAFAHARFGKKLRGLDLADLIADRLSRRGGEERRLFVRGLAVHRHHRLKIVGRLIDGEGARRKLDVDLDAQRAQPGEIVDHLARLWRIGPQPGLQHHLFGIEARALVGAAVVIMAAQRIGVLPAQSQLEEVPRNAFMHDDRPRIARDRKVEIA